MNQIKRLFGFSNAEANGFIGLLIVMLIYISLPIIYRIFPSSISKPYPLELKQIDSLENIIFANIELKKEKQQYSYENEYEHFSASNSNSKTIKLFPFDPNIASVEELKSLGLPSFIAERIEKLRATGWKFKRKEDFAKIYGLLPATYAKLAPYIQISVDATADGTKEEYKKIDLPKENLFGKKSVAFDLNKADTSMLMNIKGIGSKLSARIIKVRDLYGGFHSTNQIKKVIGLDSVVVVEVLKYAYVRNPVLRKININEAAEIRHPEIKPYLAKAIINYRNQHGKFANVDDLLKIKIMDRLTLENIRPYLEL